MRKFEVYLGHVAILIATSFGKGYALTNGPSMPEYSQFEPVDMTDMVNLATGSFTWSVPVMTVPGPALGLPLVLAYHANPGQKAEASWVGLGWNIQAGAITRQVNKIPDDFKDIPIYESVKSSSIHGWSASISYNGVTVGYSYNSLKGNGGIVGYNLLEEFDVPASVNLTYGWGSASGSTGLSIGLGYSLGYVGIGKDFGIGAAAGLSVGMTVDGGASGGIGAGGSASHQMADQNTNQVGRHTSASLASVGISLSQTGGLSAGISGLATASFASVSGSWRESKGGVTIPFFWGGWWTVGFSIWSTWIQGVEKDHYFGFLYGDAPGMGCATDPANAINCTNYNSTSYKRRHEFLSADRSLENATRTKLMRTSEDAYLVAAQGISGSFSPQRKEDGDYTNSLQSTSKVNCDWIVNCDRDRKNRTKELDLSRNRLNENSASNDIYWRYSDDMAGAEFTPQSATARNLTATASVQSKQIQAKYSANGKLIGFEIINTSGARYSFDFPLLNVWEAKYGFQDGDLDKYTSQEFGGSYAYAWLMTSIKSLDYVDRTGDGVTEDDLGGWIKITYGDGNQTTGWKPVQYWSTPYYDPTNALYSNTALNPDKKLAYSGPNPQTNATTLTDDDIRISSSRSQALGLKEISYIQKIETPTHEARFFTLPRLDGRPFKVAHPFDITNQSSAWNGTITQNNNAFTGTINVHPGTYLSDGVGDLVVQSGELLDIILMYTHTHGSINRGTCTPGLPQTDSIVFNQVRVGDTHTATQTPVILNGYDCYLSCGIIGVKVRSTTGTRNASRRLASIELYEKAALKAAGTNSGSVKPISTVKFVQDYSLCYNTPNSYGVTPSEITENPRNGKLTLKQLIIGGDGTLGTQLPPYQFSYGYNPAFQNPTVQNWVPWEIGNWDKWGNYCAACNDGYHEPDPYEAKKFSAAAWNLERILTPSGAELSINYGPKNYSYVGTEPIAMDGGSGAKKMLIASGGPEMFSDVFTITDIVTPTQKKETWWFYRTPLANIRKKISDRKWTILGYRFEMNSRQMWRHVGFSYSPLGCTPSIDYDYHRAWLHIASDSCGSDSRIGNCSVGRRILGDPTTVIPTFRSVSVYIDAATVGNASEFAAGFRTQGDFISWESTGDFQEVARQDTIEGDFRLYAILNTSGGTDPANELADGAVVTDIKMREPFSNTIQTTHYTYEGGVTPSLPATYSDYSDDRDRNGRGIEFYRGSSGVVYSKVTATTNEKYKTEYYFLTSKDLPTIFGPVPNATGSSFVSTSVTDMSALWGALWKKVDLDETGNPIRSVSTSWGVNSDYFPSGTDWDAKLPATGLLQAYPKANGNNYIRTVDTESGLKPYFGLHQTIAGNRYFNENGCYVGDDCQANIIVSQVVLKRALPVALKSETVQQGLKTTHYSYYHDFRSGEPLKSRQENSDGSVDVTERHPAYYRYTLMKEQNALSQEYATAAYHYPSGSRTDFLQAEAAPNATSTSLKIWRPYDRNAYRTALMNKSDFVTYRLFQTYAWRDNPGEASAQHWIPDDYCAPYLYNTDKIDCFDAMSPPDSRWVLTEQVNRYDAMSHATDAMDARGINQTTMYGHDRSLPVAFLENTPIPANDPAQSGTLRAFYESFEGNDEFKAKLVSGTAANIYATSTLFSKSGSTSLEVKNSSGTGGMVCFDVGVLEPDREYQASAWYYDATSSAVSEAGANRTKPGIFLGKDGGCASEYHPVGPDGISPLSGGGGGGGEIPTGSKSWKRIFTTVRSNQCPTGAQRSPAILCLYASKGGVGKNIRYDEVRVKPGGSRMSTFTYDKGRMTSSVDIREVTTFYDYDGFGNLCRLRNDDGVTISEQAKRIGQR